MSMVESGLVLRKTMFVLEDTLMASGKALSRPAKRVAAMAVFRNPCVHQQQEDLSALSAAAITLAEQLMPKLTEMLDAPVSSYGKAAIVGVLGEAEHAAALLHPTLGKPMRQAIGGGAALIPSTAKVAALGTHIDVPVGHRNDPWSFAEIDTMTLGIADAPRPDEIVLIIVLTSEGRPNARIVTAKAAGS